MAAPILQPLQYELLTLGHGTVIPMRPPFLATQIVAPKTFLAIQTKVDKSSHL